MIVVYLISDPGQEFTEHNHQCLTISRIDIHILSINIDILSKGIDILLKDIEIQRKGIDVLLADLATPTWSAPAQAS